MDTRTQYGTAISTWFCLTWFVTALIAAQLTFGFVVCVAATAWSAQRALRRPLDGLWLLLFTLAVAGLNVPPDYSMDLGGETPKAFFWWGSCLASVAGAMLIGSLLRPRRFADERRRGFRTSLPLLIFLGVVLFACVSGYAQGNSVWTIVRQGSGLVFLFCFAYLGYRLRPSLGEWEQGVRNISTVLVSYSVLYLLRILYFNVVQRATLPDGDFYRDRNPILFFCGLFAVVEFGRWLFTQDTLSRGEKWFGALLPEMLLVSAAVLSGSRAIVASMLVGGLLLLVLRFSSHPVRIVCAVVLLMAAAFYSYQVLVSQIERQDSFVQHVAARYLVSPDQDSSYLQRASQMSAIYEGLKSKPLLGDGIGASLEWFDPYSLSYVQTAFVDSGVGYLLFKTGLLGAATFLFLIVSCFRRSWQCWAFTRKTAFLVILGMFAYYSAFLPFGPSFFQFLYSFWVGILIGYLYLAGSRAAVLKPVALGVQAEIAG